LCTLECILKNSFCNYEQSNRFCPILVSWNFCALVVFNHKPLYLVFDIPTPISVPTFPDLKAKIVHHYLIKGHTITLF
jgi:hypothetical protein